VSAPVTNLLADEVVEGPGARHERPGILPAETHPFRDLFAPRSGQAARQRIAKQRVRAFGFPGAVDGDPERSVRNVLDQRFSVRHDCKPYPPQEVPSVRFSWRSLRFPLWPLRFKILPGCKEGLVMPTTNRVRKIAKKTFLGNRAATLHMLTSLTCVAIHH
jgi:hypothetical protein